MLLVISFPHELFPIFALRLPRLTLSVITFVCACCCSFHCFHFFILSSVFLVWGGGRFCIDLRLSFPPGPPTGALGVQGRVDPPRDAHVPERRGPRPHAPGRVRRRRRPRHGPPPRGRGRRQRGGARSRGPCRRAGQGRHLSLPAPPLSPSVSCSAPKQAQGWRQAVPNDGQVSCGRAVCPRPCCRRRVAGAGVWRLGRAFRRRRQSSRRAGRLPPAPGAAELRQNHLSFPEIRLLPA